MNLLRLQLITVLSVCWVKALDVLVENKLVVDDDISTKLFQDFGFRDFGQNYSSIEIIINSTGTSPLFYSLAWSVVPVQGSVSSASGLNDLVSLDGPFAGQLTAGNPLSLIMDFNCTETFVLGLITTLTLQNSTRSVRYQFKWTKYYFSMPDICYGEELSFVVHSDSSAAVAVSDWVAIYPGVPSGQVSSWVGVDQYSTWFYLTGNKSYATEPIYDTSALVPYLLAPGNYTGHYLLADSSIGPVRAEFRVKTPRECQQEDCGSGGCSGVGTCDPVAGTTSLITGCLCTAGYGPYCESGCLPSTTLTDPEGGFDSDRDPVAFPAVVPGNCSWTLNPGDDYAEIEINITDVVLPPTAYLEVTCAGVVIYSVPGGIVTEAAVTSCESSTAVITLVTPVDPYLPSLADYSSKPLMFAASYRASKAPFPVVGVAVGVPLAVLVLLGGTLPWIILWRRSKLREKEPDFSQLVFPPDRKEKLEDALISFGNLKFRRPEKKLKRFEEFLVSTRGPAWLSTLFRRDRTVMPAYVDYLYSISPDVARQTLLDVLRLELEEGPPNELFFRQESSFSAGFTRYCQLVGTPYAWRVLHGLIPQLYDSTEVPINLELDPNQNQELRHSVLQLKLLTRLLLLEVTDSIDSFPVPIRILLRATLEMLESASNDTSKRTKSSGLSKLVVRDLVFLRFFSPALTFPEQWGLIKPGTSTPQLRRNCILLSKALQMAANQELFEESNIMAVLNESIEDNQDQMRAFFKELLTEPEATLFDYEISIPSSIQSACLKELLVASATLLRSSETDTSQSVQSDTVQAVNRVVSPTIKREKRSMVKTPVESIDSGKQQE